LHRVENITEPAFTRTKLSYLYCFLDIILLVVLFADGYRRKQSKIDRPEYETLNSSLLTVVQFRIEKRKASLYGRKEGFRDRLVTSGLAPRGTEEGEAEEDNRENWITVSVPRRPLQ
jgi:hypothetical protein